MRQSDRDRETTASGQESEKQKKEGVENVKKKKEEKRIGTEAERNRSNGEG